MNCSCTQPQTFGSDGYVHYLNVMVFSRVYTFVKTQSCILEICAVYCTSPTSLKVFQQKKSSDTHVKNTPFKNSQFSDGSFLAGRKTQGLQCTYSLPLPTIFFKHLKIKTLKKEENHPDLLLMLQRAIWQETKPAVNLPSRKNAIPLLVVMKHSAVLWWESIKFNTFYMIANSLKYEDAVTV